MGKHFNAEIYRQIVQEPEQEIDDSGWEESELLRPTEEDFEADFSDWKHRKDDDHATAVRRYAVPVRHVELWDERRAG